MLKKQHFELLNLMEEEKSLSKLSEILSLSERSIRYKIDEINEKLDNEAKIRIKKREIISTLSSIDVLKVFNEVESTNYIYSQNEREELIILYTLLKKDTFLLKEIADKLNTSKSTIRSDIKNIKRKLEEYNIRILQDNQLKYYYDYSEEDYRYFITTYLYKYIDFDGEYSKFLFTELSYFKKLIYNEIREEYIVDIEKVAKRIRDIKLSFMEETINILATLMVVSHNREQKGRNIVVKNSNILEKRYEYKKMKDLFLEFSEENILFFVDYLFRIGRDERDIFIKFENWIDIIVAVNKIVRNFEIENKLELKNVDLLLNQVFYYIKPLIFRSLKKIELKNSILRDIEDLYPEIFSFLKNNFSILERVIGVKISESEIAYITPLFYKALQEDNKSNKKALLVTNYKENIALFLKEEIESEFLLDIDKIISLKNFEDTKKEQKKYDYILVTFKVDEKLEKEFERSRIIEINPILTENDRKKFENENLLRNKKLKLSKLLKVILSNTDSVNMKNLISDLNKNFSDEIYNDVEKGKFTLENFVEKKNIYKVNFQNIKELLNNFYILSFLKKNDINDIINKINNNIFYSYIGNKVGIVFHKMNSEDNVLVAINEKDLYINNEKINILVLVNSNCGIKYKGIIYNFVKLFFKNYDLNVNHDRLNVYDYLISNI